MDKSNLVKLRDKRAQAAETTLYYIVLIVVFVVLMLALYLLYRFWST